MDFKKPLSQEQYGKERLYRHHRTNFVAGSILILFFLFSQFSSCGTAKSRPEPTQKEVQYASDLTTLEGRTFSIGKTYADAKIIKERTYGKDIISVFTVGDKYSFCVFEALEDGYWMEYCGNLFPKSEMVKGTVRLGDNTNEYDIYLQYETNYSHLLVTRTYMKYPKLKQKQNVRFDENGIGIMKLDPGRYYPNPRIEAYDAEGNQYVLEDGIF